MADAGHGSRQACLIGIGSCAPATRVTNAQLEAVVETSDEWISQRTGIRSRHLLQPGETLSDLAKVAAANALAHAGVDASEVELVILATSSPDDMFGDAAGVAHSIGATNAVAFDLTAACSGFLFGMNTASQFLHTGAYKTAIVIGADALSRWVDWGDRNTCVLFGDGAGAVVMRAAADGEQGGMLGFEMHSNGAGRCDLNLGYTGATHGASCHAAACATSREPGTQSPPTHRSAGAPASAHRSSGEGETRWLPLAVRWGERALVAGVARTVHSRPSLHSPCPPAPTPRGDMDAGASSGASRQSRRETMGRSR